MTSSSLAPDPIADLWQTARAWCARALAELGGAASIAAAVAREAQAACKRRLRFVEAFVMKLLLIEASRLPFHHPFPDVRIARIPGPMNTGGADRATTAAFSSAPHVFIGPGLGAARQSGNGCAEDPANPQTWRVRFHARLPLARRRRAATNTLTSFQPTPRHDRAHYKARVLARRFEALARIIADPRRAIAALARRLAALGVHARAAAHRIALAGPRQGGGMIFARASILALDASAGLDDSS